MLEDSLKELPTLAEECKRERTRSGQLAERVQRLMADLRAKEVDIEDVLIKLTTVQQRERQRQEEMQRKIESLMAERDSMQSQRALNEHLQSTNKQLAERIQNQDRTREELETALKVTKADLEAMAKTKETIDQFLHQVQDQVASLKGQLGKETQEREQASHQTRQLEEDRQRLERELRDRDAKLQEQALKLDAKETALEDLRTKHTHLLGQCTDVQLALRRREDDVARLTTDGHAWQLKFEHLEERYHRDLATIRTALDEAERTTGQLTADLSLLKAKYDSDLSALRKEDDACKRELEAVRGSLRARTESHDRTLDDLQRARTMLARLEEENAMLQSRPVNLTGYVDEKLLTRAKRELERVVAASQRDGRIHQLRIEELEEELRQLKANTMVTTPEQKAVSRAVDAFAVNDDGGMNSDAKETTPKQQFKYQSLLSPSVPKAAESTRAAASTRAATSTKATAATKAVASINQGHETVDGAKENGPANDQQQQQQQRRRMASAASLATSKSSNASSRQKGDERCSQQ